MGNCLKSLHNDNVSLIRGRENRGPITISAPIPQPLPHFYRREQPQQQNELGSLAERFDMKDSSSLQSETEQWMPVYHPSPGVSREANQLTEEEQIKIAHRLGIISHLPTGKYDDTSKQAKECVICMNEFTFGEMLRYLPCMHVYHKECIDEWLMRSFNCPSCMESVDAALLLTYQTG